MVAFTAPAAADDMRAIKVALGLIPPDVKSMPASAGLKLPRNAETASGESAAALAGSQGFPDGSQAAWYGGVRANRSAQGTETFRGLLYPLSGRWLSTVETSASDGSGLGPQHYSFTSRLHATLGSGWNFSVGLKHSVFGAPFESGYGGTGPSGAAMAGSPLAPTLYPGSESATSYQLRFNYLYDQRNLVGLSYTTGKDDYLYSPLDRPLHETHQFMLSGQHWLTPKWSINYDVYAPDSGNLLQRQGLRLGLRYRF